MLAPLGIVIEREKAEATHSNAKLPFFSPAVLVLAGRQDAVLNLDPDILALAEVAAERWGS